MRIKKLVYILVAVAAVACSKNNPEDSLTVTPTEFKVDRKDTSVVVDIQSSQNYSVTVDKDCEEWIRTSVTVPTSASSFTVSISENDAFASRTGSVTVDNGLTSKKITVSQSGVAPVLELEKSKVAVNFIGGETSVKVTHNGLIETVIPSDVDWITGATDTKVTTVTENLIFNVAKNLTASERSAVIKVADVENGISENLTITQSGSTKAPDEAPYKEGYNVRGVVKDEDGLALADVVVSDGYQCVKTDASGCYYLKTNESMSMTVFPICPAEYDRNYDQTSGLWSDWKAIDYTNSKFSANFSLKTKKGDINNCRMILLGDPQRINHREHSKVAWTEFCKDLNQYKSTVNVPLYQIIMGDMVTDEMEVDEYAKAFIETLGTSGLRTNTLVGNHDHVTDAKNYYDSVKDYVKHFGPYNYAFNIAGFHVIVLDSVSWKNEDWDTGFNTEAATFLKNDMAFVPAGVPIIICTHCPITKKFGGTIPSNSSIENFATYRAQMKGRDVYMFYGHSHITAFWKYTDSELSSYATGLKSLSSCTVGRCNGAWSCSGEICRDGVPWGVVELDLNGSDIKWQFKSFEPDKYLDNINVYLPGQFKGEDIDSKRDDTMYCNVYVWDNSWSTPELWSNGKKVSSFIKCRYFKSTTYDSWADMLHEHFYNIWKVSDIPGFRPDSGQEPYDNCHLFKLVPPAGVTSGTVKVTDRWGREYSKDVSW